MKINTEIKVAGIGIITILVLIWGVNYLKGRNILSSAYSLHAFYTETAGLESSAPVLLKGVKIGYVDRIILRMDEEEPIELILQIEKEYPLCRESAAVLGNADLLGAKAILIQGPGCGKTYNNNDTIKSFIEKDLMSQLKENVFPLMEQFSHLSASLDTLSKGLNQIVSDEGISRLIDNLSEVSSSLRTSFAPGGSLERSFGQLESFTAMLVSKEDELALLINNMKELSGDLDKAGLDSLALELKELAGGMNTMLTQVNSESGSIGKLLYSDSLHINLNQLLTDLDKLVRDLNENPEDYVHISVFGGKSKKDSR